MPYSQDAIDRFWSYVDKRGPDECWMWTGRIDKDGYGRFTVGDRREGAHRVSLIISGRQIPPGRMVIHSCDLPKCVNPAHLRVGDALDNARDCYQRMRYWKQKMTEDDAVDAIGLVCGGAAVATVAKKYGVGFKQIQKILYGESHFGARAKYEELHGAGSIKAAMSTRPPGGVQEGATPQAWVDIAIAAVSAGATVRDAANALGVHPSTLYRRLRMANVARRRRCA